MRYIFLLYRIIVIIIIVCLRRIWSPILLSVLQTELMRVMWIMFFSKLRIWAWFSSAEINGSLSIHLNEAASTFPTLQCKTRRSSCLIEGIRSFQKSLRTILSHQKSVLTGQEKRTYIHEGISIREFLMSGGNTNISLLLFSRSSF